MCPRFPMPVACMPPAPTVNAKFTVLLVKDSVVELRDVDPE